jgi:hypothetical protein
MGFIPCRLAGILNMGADLPFSNAFISRSPMESQYRLSLFMLGRYPRSFASSFFLPFDDC